MTLRPSAQARGIPVASITVSATEDGVHRPRSHIHPLPGLPKTKNALPSLWSLWRRPSSPTTSAFPRRRHPQGLHASRTQFGTDLLDMGGAHVVGHCIASGDMHGATRAVILVWVPFLVRPPPEAMRMPGASTALVLAHSVAHRPSPRPADFTPANRRRPSSVQTASTTLWHPLLRPAVSSIA